jgi:hypothetical protein
LPGAISVPARTKGVQLDLLKADTESEIDAAFASLVDLHAGALLVGPDPIFNNRRDQLVALASRHAVPAIYFQREFTAADGLISYGPSFPAIYRQAGDQRAAVRLMRKLLKKQGFAPKLAVTHKLRSYAAVYRELHLTCRHEQGLRMTNRAENSH